MVHRVHSVRCEAFGPCRMRGGDTQVLVVPLYMSPVMCRVMRVTRPLLAVCLCYD